ncbi:hypothetical protein HQ45_09550 [Porphyromonas crevioricanis]|nr:hypothetical protein HQ45_09550 [Porphyromonas crevioricanis]
MLNLSLKIIMKKRITLLSLLIVSVGMVSSLWAQEAQKNNVDINLRGGIGVMTMTHKLITPFVSNTSMTADAWIHSNLKIGVEVSFLSMTLQDQFPALTPKQHELNQLFVGPVISFCKRSELLHGWGANASLSLGYTYLSRGNSKGALSGAYQSFNKDQHAFGANLNAEIRRYIGHFYLGLGYTLGVRVFEMGATSNTNTLFNRIGIPQLALGVVL